MVYKQDTFNLEKHPFDDFILNSTERLIIGSFPTHRKNRMFEFYYGSQSNHFWPIISEVFKTRFDYISGNSAIEERKQFAKAYKIGFTDMLECCYRMNESSGDENLYPVKWKDIIEILEKHQSIKSLIFTSRTEAIGALGLFKTLLFQKGMKIPIFEKFEGVLEGNFELNNRNIEIIVPYSPSNRNIKNNTKKVVKMYGYALNDWKLRLKYLK